MTSAVDIKFDYDGNLVEIMLDGEARWFAIACADPYVEAQIVALISWVVSKMADKKVSTPVQEEYCLCDKCKAFECPWKRGEVKIMDELKAKVEFSRANGLLEVSIGDEHGVFLLPIGMSESHQDEVVSLVEWLVQTTQDATTKRISRLIRAGVEKS